MLESTLSLLTTIQLSDNNNSIILGKDELTFQLDEL